MLNYSRGGAALAFAFAALFSSTALADDWTAVKLRGVVVGLFDGEWVKLERDAVVPDDQPIRTLASGRVTFQRGDETVELGPNTQVQIIDRAGYSKFTTVKQHYGRVAVEAEVRNVKHFSVETPYLAAVVKGTRFVVISGEDGARVQVERGAVAVENSADRSSVVVEAGQEAAAAPGQVMAVSGRGKLPEVIDRNGKPVEARAEAARDRGKGAAGNGGNSAEKGGNSSKSDKSSGRSDKSSGHGGASSGQGGDSRGKSGNSSGKSGEGKSKGD
ncbi:MAG TPA: FecR family protein [Devosiaceae bacterium]|jgi:hypothetical protein|nr:FecR family protein [Devosiaceae bacterium]